MKMVVTGVTGYIGTRFATIAATLGHEVVSASRQQPSNCGVSWFHFDLASDEPVLLPMDTDVVVHLAANTLNAISLDTGTEVTAAQRLIGSAQKVGARFIFVSSQTARADAPTSYGQTKWRIEQEVLAAGGWVVRPGQVYGGELRGLYGTLVNIVLKLRILPAFLPTPKVQPIHVDDLAEGLLHIADRDDLKPGVYCLAGAKPISFSSFLAEIARSRLRCKRLFVPVSVVAVNFLARVVGTAWRNKLGLDRLRSLFDLPEMATASDLNTLGLTLRPLSDGLHPSGDARRRCLLREGQALLTYVLKEQPDMPMSRRYARAIESLRVGRAMELPRIFLNYPILLSLLSKTSWSDESLGAEYMWRLDTATLLAEACPAGARRFLGLSSEHGLLISMLSLTTALICETFWRLVRAFASPVLRLTMGRAKGVLWRPTLM